MATPPLWRAPLSRGAVDATVTLPGSKSLTNRYLVVAALAEGPSRLRAPLRSRDTLLMAAALGALGARVEDDGPEGTDWLLTPGELHGAGPVDCGLAGTVMRFVPPVAALAHGRTVLDGDDAARSRPMGPLLGALRALGADVRDDAGHLPLVVEGDGALRGGQVELDASSSSQFVSALLLAGARTRQGVLVRHEGPPLPSAPHVAMTLEVLASAGVSAQALGGDAWAVDAGPVSALDVLVEPDLSNAAPFLAAAVVTGGRVTVPGWPARTTQAGDELRDLLDAMGADVDAGREGLTVTGSGELYGLDADLHDVGELTPALAALAVLAESPSSLRGIAHLRGHETDRLHALATQLGGLGADVTETDDGLRIRPAALHGGVFATYGDHRMATAAAVVGLRVPGVDVVDVATTAKTLPDFPERWAAMLGQR